MSTPITLSDLDSIFTQLTDCCLHKPTWTPGDAVGVLASVQNDDSVWSDESGVWTDCKMDEYGNWKAGTDSGSYTVVQLRDGRYGLLSESEDYTGHGCQCGAATGVYSSLRDLLLLGVIEGEARDALAARLPEEKATPGRVDPGEV